MAVGAALSAASTSYASVHAQESPLSSVSSQVRLDRLDRDRLRLGRDSLAIQFSGLPEGSHVLELVRSNGGYRFTDEVVLTSNFRRTTTVTLDAAFRITAVHIEGREFGHSTAADIQYGSGRATGRAMMVHEGRLQRRTIDVDLPDGTFDGSVLLAVLPALTWEVGKRHRLLMYDCAEGTVTEQTLTVTAAEDIVVPAGAYRAFHGTLTTTQRPVDIWVAHEAPHRVLKIGSANGATVLVT